MDVNLPDGTVIRDVPEGTTQQQLLRKLFDAKHPAYNALAEQMMKDGGWGSGFPKFANELGGKVTDAIAGKVSPEMAAGAGYVTNVATQAVPALLSSYRFTEAPVSLAESPAKWLMQSAVKPSQADRLSGASGRAMTTMLEENLSPTIGGMDKASKLARSLDQQAERAIAGSHESVSMYDVGQRLQDPARKALTQVNPQADIDTVKNTWQSFKDSPLVQQQAILQGQYGPAKSATNLPAPLGAGQAVQDVSLPVQLAHELKKGTYQALGGKSYGEVGSAATEAQKALARGLREEVAAAVPEAGVALKREASLMNVKDVAMNRALLEANKNPMGLGALRIGDNPLSTVGFVADRSAYLKGLLARALYRGAQPQLIAPAGIAASEAAQGAPSQW